MIKIFKLLKNNEVIKITLDIEDFELYNNYNWSISRNRKNGVTYLISVKNKVRRILHREVLKAGKNKMIDHVNGDGLDNRKKNLRYCNSVTNGQNSRKKEQGLYTSRFKGVHRYNKSSKWRASITVNKKTFCLSLYDSEIAAALAYNIAAKKYFKDFARINNICRVKNEQKDKKG